MSRSVRLFVRFMAAVLVTAIAAPFYLTGPGGHPILSLDRITSKLRLPAAVAEVFEKPAREGSDKLRVVGATVYRWEDQYGIWQFGEAPPEGVDAEAMEVQSSITPLGADWVVEVPEQDDADPMPSAVPGNPLEVYAQAPELIDRAKQVAAQMEARNQELDLLTH